MQDQNNIRDNNGEFAAASISAADEQAARVTAYVLDELEGDARVAFERELQRDEALAAEVASMRSVSERLRHELAGEPELTLTSEQRERIAEGPAEAPTPYVFVTRTRMIWGGVGLAAAACLAVAIMAPNWGADRGASGGLFSLNEPAASEREVADEVQSFATAPREAMRERAAGADADGPARMRSEPDRSLGARGGAPAVPAVSEPSGIAGRHPATQPNPIPPPSFGEVPGTGSDAPRPDDSRTTPEAEAPHDAVFSTPKADADMADVRARLNAELEEVNEARQQATPEREAELDVRAAELQDRLRELRDAADDFNTEQYARVHDNPFRKVVADDPTSFSTFSIETDTASYSNVRRFIEQQATLPPPDAVRIEEMINYFPFSYDAPSGDRPFAVNVEVGQAPWNPQHQLLKIGIKGREVDLAMRPPTSLTFLLDVSGSMNRPNKLPLVRQAMKMLVDRLTEDDRIAIVTYAGNAGVLLEPTYCFEKATIIDALDSLSAGGSTNGAGGINAAYDLARQQFIEGGVNRVILCTDGDFNVGVSSDGELVRLIEQQRKSGVFLSVLGFGTGNFKDAKMEQLSNAGNGNYAYIDSLDEAHKVLVEQMGGTLVTIAKDVKIQMDFDPDHVAWYRLIGYENRVLAAEDFLDDSKDAGEIGAGHTVTALYELVSPDVPFEEREIRPSEFAEDAEDASEASDVDTRDGGATPAESKSSDDEIGGRAGLDLDARPRPVTENERQPAGATDERNDALVDEQDRMLVVRFRYKAPDAEESTGFDVPVFAREAVAAEPSEDFHFAAAVAEFGMLLRNSPERHRGEASFAQVIELAEQGSTTERAVHDAVKYLSDFVQYTNHEREDLGAANLKQLLETPLNEAQWRWLLNHGSIDQDALRQAIEYGVTLEIMREEAMRLQQRHQAAAGNIDRQDGPLRITGYRTQFIELVRQAKAIAETRGR